MSVKSVYNFVPAPKESEVFKPDWADQVNHDIPFSDGESGEIDITIAAETPIFIRNGHSKDKEGNEFSNYTINGEKKYFIPATSLKGMFRNVLEIITSSRMNLTDNISEKDPITYGLRDMNNPEYTADNTKVKSGWLMKNGEGWKIKSCTNNKIALRDIEDKFNLGTSTLKGTTGKSKNELCKEHIYNQIFNFSFFKDLGKWVGDQYRFDSDGGLEGYIVLYGDIDNKRYDYIFSIPNGIQYTVDSELVETLDNIEKNNENPGDSLWLYFRKENWQPGIPVFFVPNGDGKTVKHFGLTKLYRRNNSYYLNKLEPFKGYLNSTQKDKLDFAELLFGTVRTEALKGRVFISHAWSDDAKVDKLNERILNAPKPSFYPAYLNQEGERGQLKKAYKTYHNQDAELRGFKKYPIHLDIKPNIESDNENISSQFIPLISGTFKGKIRYFNLRPFELGALISAITFHGNSDKFYHSIGGVKPYGFGKIKVEINRIVVQQESVNGIVDQDEYLNHFETKMNEHFRKTGEKDFHLNGNVVELLSIVSEPKDALVNNLLVYPLLEKEEFINGKPKTINEFNEYKKAKEYLENYSERNGVKNFTSIKQKMLKQKNEEDQVRKEEAERLAKVEELNAYNLVRSSPDIAVLIDFIDTYPYGSYTEEIKTKLESLRKDNKKAEAHDILKESLTFEKPSFKFTKDYLNERYKKLAKYGLEYTDSQKHQIENQLKSCWEKDNASFYKRKNLAKISDFPWTDIVKWLGTDLAHSLYNTLINTQ